MKPHQQTTLSELRRSFLTAAAVLGVVTLGAAIIEMVVK
jgi:hypothetical protein